MSNLKARLKRIRETNSVNNQKKNDNINFDKEIEKPSFVEFENWTNVNIGLRKKIIKYYKTDKSILDNSYIFSLINDNNNLSVFEFSDRLIGKSVNIENILFFDFETTGLSGGSGTIAFLAAFGKIKNDYIEVSQYFIDDYCYEDEFIKTVSEQISDCDLIVTYNGSSFDIPLLKTRCIMTKNKIPLIKNHADLLYTSRLLYKTRIDSCSMQNIENKIFNKKRQDDLPGSEAPEAYFEYLKTKNTLRLFQVFKHNEEDIISLVNIFFAIKKATSKKFILPDCDKVGLARIITRCNVYKGECAYKNALESGDRRATRPLMKLLSKQNRKIERYKLIPFLPDDCDGFYFRAKYALKVENNITKAKCLILSSLENTKNSMKKKERAEKLLLVIKNALQDI